MVQPLLRGAVRLVPFLLIALALVIALLPVRLIVRSGRRRRPRKRMPRCG